MSAKPFESFENAKAFLKKADGKGRTLHDHLTDVLMTIAKEQPSNPLESFEAISVRVKESQLQSAALGSKDGVLSAEGPSSLFSARKFLPQLDAKSKAALIAATNSTAALLQPAPLGEDAEESEWDAASFPDLLQQAKLLEWAGVSLGEDVTVKLALSLQQLAKKSKLTNVRLWGKIFGTVSDYIVAEAKLSEPSDKEEEAGSKNENPGQGTNEYTYFCISPNNIGEAGQWFQLPDVTTVQIKKARQMRRYLTGSLFSSVPGFPHWQWSELHYLRAQIARITSATVLAPKGKLSLNTEEEPAVLTEEEEFKGVPASELVSADGWVHARPFLLQQARYTKWVAPEKEEEEESGEEQSAKPKTPEQEEEEAEAAEEEVEQLRAVSEDKSSASSTGAWSFRVYPSGVPAADAPHAVAVARSSIWPGAVAVAQSNSKEVVNFYIGYGQKNLGSINYSPPTIPKVQSEYIPEQKEDEEQAAADPLAEQTDLLPPPPKTAEELAAEAGDNADENAEDHEEADE